MWANSTQVHFNYSLALFEFGRHEESTVHLDKVLAVEPDNARALHHKAMLLTVARGQMDDARALIERAIAVYPQQPSHYAMLAKLKHIAADDPLIATMEGLLQGGVAPDQDTAGLHFALAKAYRDSEQREASFPPSRAGQCGDEGAIRIRRNPNSMRRAAGKDHKRDADSPADLQDFGRALAPISERARATAGGARSGG